jgi:hypothetical protein
MGLKRLHRYPNPYGTASPEAKDLARRLSSLEETLVTDIRPYL